MTILVFIVVIIGGLGSVTGCFVGAILSAWSPNYVGFLAPAVALGSNIALMCWCCCGARAPVPNGAVVNVRSIGLRIISGDRPAIPSRRPGNPAVAGIDVRTVPVPRPRNRSPPHHASACS